MNPQDMSQEEFEGHADYLTKEDEEAIKKMPKSVFDFMGIKKPDDQED
jgi:hypothetical protein